MRKYHWVPDVPDHRDLIAAPHAGALPAKVDRLGMDNPIEDQGQLGSCTGNSTTSALEITLGDGVPRSRLMAYYQARVVEGTVRQDAGAMIRDVVKQIFKLGVAAEKLWPYIISKFAKTPSKAAKSDGAKLVPTLAAGYEYARVPDLATIKLYLSQGHGVVFGFSVPASFETYQPGTVQALPGAREQILGGHAVVAVGYDDTAPTPFVWVRNSWGDAWGEQGYFRIDQRYFSGIDTATGLVSDCWVIRRKGT